MHISQRKEQFSFAWAHAVASASGIGLLSPPVDDDSVDACLMAKGEYGGRRSPRLDLQLKCTKNDTGGNEHLSFPLEQKNYDELRPTDFIVKRILVVIVVPEDHVDWISVEAHGMLLRYRGYYLSLEGQPPNDNDQKTTVYLPRENLLTPDRLRALMGMPEEPVQGAA